jgi:hypothetical protein
VPRATLARYIAVYVQSLAFPSGIAEALSLEHCVALLAVGEPERRRELAVRIAAERPTGAEVRARARCTWESAGETVANMITRPGYQVADVENSISSSNTLGTDTQTGNGVKYGSAPTDISSVTQAKQVVRWGLWVKNPSGTTTVQCVRAGGVIEVEES